MHVAMFISKRCSITQSKRTCAQTPTIVSVGKEKGTPGDRTASHRKPHIQGNKGIHKGDMSQI